MITRVITADTRQRVNDALAAALRDGNDEVRSVASTAIDVDSGKLATLRCASRASVRGELRQLG